MFKPSFTLLYGYFLGSVSAESLFLRSSHCGKQGDWPGGVLLGIQGGDVQPSSPNPQPYFRPKNVIIDTRLQTSL